MATQVKVNQNDPRVRRTRALLKGALSELLAEKSFHDITVQNITDRATLNRVTFYAHFDDKFDLMSSWVRDAFVERLEAALPLSSPRSADNLHLLCRVVLESLRETQTHCRRLHGRYGPLFESAVQEALYAFILEWLQTSVAGEAARGEAARGEVAPGLRVEAVAAVMSWTLFGAGIDWSRSTDPHPLDRAVDDIVSVLLRGVSEMFPQRRPIAMSDDTAEPGSRTGRHDHAAHVALRR